MTTYKVDYTLYEQTEIRQGNQDKQEINESND